MVLGSHMTEEQRAKISTARMGQRMSDEAKGKDATAHHGLKASLETRSKMSVSGMGHPYVGPEHHSPETRAKISAGLRGKPKSLEERVKDSISHMGHLVSPETRAKQSAVNNHGLTSLNRLVRHRPEYVAWRTAVFARDNYTCQDCGDHGGYLEAHHIHEFAKYPDERFVVENGKTLCLKCHDKTKSRKAHVIEVIP